MRRLWILQGLPASGKSAWATAKVAAEKSTARVNKDTIRQLLHNGQWSHERERATFATELAMARALFASGVTDVLVDDTNLHPSVIAKWLELAKNEQAEVHYERFDVPVEACVSRDRARGASSVGPYVIRNMAMRYGLKKFESGRLILCDVDGTVADLSHRLHHIRREDGKPKDWEAFFAKVSATIY